MLTVIFSLYLYIEIHKYQLLDLITYLLRYHSNFAIKKYIRPLSRQLYTPLIYLHHQLNRLIFHFVYPVSNIDYRSPLIFLIILGIKNENAKSPREKKTLNDISWPQSPEDQTSFRVPIKNVKMKVPTRIPSPVPKK